jgi:hydrogenase maturation protease
VNAFDADLPNGDRVLVIGVGNEVRGDDGAGLQVVHELRSVVGDQIRIVDCRGGVAELLDLWEGLERVYVVDAILSGRAPGSWLRVPVGDQPLPSSLSGTSTHGLSLASAVALGQILGRMPKQLVVYGIEAARFEPGAKISPPVLLGVREVVRALTEELTRTGLLAPPGPRRT